MLWLIRAVICVCAQGGMWPGGMTAMAGGMQLPNQLRPGQVDMSQWRPAGMQLGELV